MSTEGDNLEQALMMIENNILIEEAKRLTEEYTIKNQCFATFDIENQFNCFDDNSFHKRMSYRFYAKPKIKNSNTQMRETIIEETEYLEDLIQKIKELVNQEKNQ